MDSGCMLEVTPLTQFERTSLLSLFWFYKDKTMFILGFFYGSAKCDLFMGSCSLSASVSPSSRLCFQVSGN